MNMRVQMTDEELLAQRAARTGRQIPVSKAGNASPEDKTPQRNPLEGFNPATGEGFDVDGNADNSPAGDDEQDSHQNSPAVDDVAALRQQLEAANGRNAPTQRALEEMRATMAALQQQLAAKDAELNTLTASKAAERAAKEAESFDPFEGMSADQIALIDPATLDAMRLAARKSLAKVTANIQDPQKLINDALAARDKRALETFVRAKADELRLVALGNDAKFQKFLQDDDSAGLLLNAFVQAPDVETAKSLETRVRTMLKRYEKSLPANSKNPPADPQSRLAVHLSRTGSGDGAPRSQRKALTPEEAKEIRIRANLLTRNRKFKEANELLAQLS